MIIVIYVNIIEMTYDPYKLEIQILHNAGHSSEEYVMKWIYSQVKEHSANNFFCVVLFMV